MRVRLHPTFLWLLLFVLLVGGVHAVAGAIIVFTFVVLHELSHSLAARAHGVHVHDITLLPIGGVARLSEMPEHPATEIRIAIAGPLFNFAVVGATYAILSTSGPFLTAGMTALLQLVLWVNLVLGVFNLIPAFPMDGGRVLRAYLASRVGYLEATFIAARVGRWFAALMAAASLATLLSPGMSWRWELLLIAVFIWVSGRREALAVAARHSARGLWDLLGFVEPGYGRGVRRPPPLPPDPPDVIDVEGHVRPGPETSAAEAFRRLAEEMDTHLNRGAGDRTHG